MALAPSVMAEPSPAARRGPYNNGEGEHTIGTANAEGLRSAHLLRPHCPDRSSHKASIESLPETRANAN